MWIDVQKPLPQCYIQLFLDLNNKYQTYFTKGKGKGNIDKGNDQFGTVRLYDFLGFLKHSFKNQNEVNFASRVLDYVTAQNFKIDFTVNNQSKYIVSDEEIKQQLTATSQMNRYDAVLVHQLNFALFSLAIQLQDFKFSLEQRLQSFQFKSYSLISIADFLEFLSRIEELSIFIPEYHKEVFTLFLSSFEGMQDVVQLQFPPRKVDSPRNLSSPSQRIGTPFSSLNVSGSGKKKRKYSDLYLDRQNSMTKAIKHQIADPLEINIIEIAGEEESLSSGSDHHPLYIDIQRFIQVLKREEIHVNSHSVQISNLGIYLGFLRAIEESDQQMIVKVQTYLTRVNQVKDLKNDFSYFRNALKHFIPYIDLVKVSRIFSAWSKQCDCQDISTLSEIFLETVKNEDLKAGHTLLLSQEKLSRPPTPRKQSPSNIDFRKRTSYLAPQGGQFRGNEVLRRISDMK